MKDMRRVFVRPRPRSQKAMIVAATAAVALWGFLGILPGVGGQAFAQMIGSQNPNLLQNNQQTMQNDRFPQIPSVRMPRRTERQKQALVDYNFNQMKKHVKRLAELAASLQKEIAKTNENVLSLEIVKKAEKVEKLAKKIKNEAKGD